MMDGGNFTSVMEIKDLNEINHFPAHVSYGLWGRAN